MKVYYYNYITVPELFLIMSYHKVLIRRKFLKYIPIRPIAKETIILLQQGPKGIFVLIQHL